ncbi:hypothetical protein ACVWZZ_007432 [Bradyrhizobium sp. LM6.10]
MDLAGAEREVDLLQRMHSTKTFADPAHFQQERSRIRAVLHRDVTPTGAR